MTDKVKGVKDAHDMNNIVNGVYTLKELVDHEPKIIDAIAVIAAYILEDISYVLKEIHTECIVALIKSNQYIVEQYPSKHKTHCLVRKGINNAALQNCQIVTKQGAKVEIEQVIHITRNKRVLVNAVGKGYEIEFIPSDTSKLADSEYHYAMSDSIALVISNDNKTVNKVSDNETDS